MRLFTGFEVSQEFKESFLQLQKENNGLDGVKWTKIDHLHLTSWFLGEVPDESLDNIKSALSLISKQVHPTQLEFEKLKVAPNQKSGRMIWAKYFTNEKFDSIVFEHRKIFEKIGLVEKRFERQLPHITLARFKEGKFQNNDFCFDQKFAKNIALKNLTLWTSKQGNEGSIYTKIVDFKL